MPRSTSRTDVPKAAVALGLGAAVLLDSLLGDPRRGHPVAGFGTVAALLERSTYRDARMPGLLHTIALVGGAVALGVTAERLAGRPFSRLAATAAAGWIVLGGTSLGREATTLHGQLSVEDLGAARVQITHLVGRDPTELDATELARACVESVAENTSDAVVAPLFWGAVCGIPGLLGYRAINTLDAMIGHRSPRYERFGWFAATLDDVVNVVPARLAGLLAAAAAPLVGGSSGSAWRAMRRDAWQHPSPNAGVVESGFAGALGVRLGGSNRYHGVLEDRGVLGDGDPVTVADIPRAARLARLVGLGAAAVAVAVAALADRRPSVGGSAVSR